MGELSWLLDHTGGGHPYVSFYFSLPASRMGLLCCGRCAYGFHIFMGMEAHVALLFLLHLDWSGSPSCLGGTEDLLLGWGYLPGLLRYWGEGSMTVPEYRCINWLSLQTGRGKAPEDDPRRWQLWVSCCVSTFVLEWGVHPG